MQYSTVMNPEVFSIIIRSIYIKY